MKKLYGLNVPNINEERKFEVGDIVVCWISNWHPNLQNETFALRRFPVVCKVIKKNNIDYHVLILAENKYVVSYPQYMKPFQQFVDEEIETLEKYRENLLKLSDEIYNTTNEK
jgi:hypothetical protein